MSPHVENFVHSLVEMAKAMETLPTVQHELAEAHKTIEHQREIIQRVELKLLDRAAEISNLQASIRNLEVSRDDAELRFLEADDIASTLKNALRDVMAKIDGTLKAVEPVLPPTEVVEEPQATSTTQADEVHSVNPTPPSVVDMEGMSSNANTTTETTAAPMTSISFASGGHTEAGLSEQPMDGNTETGESAPNPTTSTSQQHVALDADISGTQSFPVSAMLPEGESVSNPTPAETPTDVSPPQTNAETTTASPTIGTQATDGVSVSPDPIVNTTIEHPTAPPQAVSTSDVGSSQTEGSDDKEPQKYDAAGFLRQEWWDWADRQWQPKRA